MSREEKTFEQFMAEAKFRLRGAHKFPLSPDELATVDRIRKIIYSDKNNSSPESPGDTSPTRSASRRKPRKLDFEVREEKTSEVTNKEK